MIAKDFDFGKDCSADNEEWQGEVGMQLGDKKLIVQRASVGAKNGQGAPIQIQVRTARGLLSKSR